MKDRIAKFLAAENISSSKFADEIGVQRSSISHIIAGRNNPSLELIQKMLNRFDSINPEWLILGKGEMYRQGKSATLFDQIIENKEVIVGKKEMSVNKETIEENTNHAKAIKTSNIENKEPIVSINNERSVEKMLIIYSDGTFETFSPAR